MALPTDVSAALATLKDPAAQLDVRIRALYEVKKLASPAVAHFLLSAIDTTESVLLQHEILYNIGQFGDLECITPLKAVARAKDRYDEVSRHEAIESIGAIGQEAALPFLDETAADASEVAPVRETAELAAARIRLCQTTGKEAYAKLVSPHFGSVDPAPATVNKDITVLEATLMDPKAAMFERYRAMFALRDVNTAESVAVLGRALRADQSSCLFRHEVAFVLGQLENPATIPALTESLKDESEHGMVRHESAEALGAMADDATWAVLKQYAADPQPIVRDSCVVALAMHEYWSQWKGSKPAEDA